MRLLMSTGLLALAQLVLAACSSDSLPEDATAPGPAGAEAPAFLALAERAQNGTYKFDFRLLGPTGEEETGTFYRKAPKFRLDRSLSAEGLRSFTTIWREGELIECETAEGGQWGCLTRSSEDPVDGLPIVVKSPEGFEIAETAGRVVAGQATTCYVAVPRGEVQPPFPEEFEICFSGEGALLFQRTRFTPPPAETGTPGPPMETAREATSYSSTVEDSDFEPPVEPARR